MSFASPPPVVVPPFPSAGGLYAVNSNIDNELFALEFFHKIFTTDEGQRRSALQECSVKLLVPSPDPVLVKKLLRTIGRLASTAPLDDVKEAIESYYRHLESLGYGFPKLPASPSRFVPASRIVSLSTPNELIRQLFVENFVQTAHVTNMMRIVAWHPRYMEAMHRSFDFLMRGEGPLPIPWRIYIALMAASRHRCRYLVSFEELMFLWAGGDEEWLRGLQYAPKKLQDLAWLNAYLAHQPWLITKDRVSQLVRGSDAWSMSELVQALVLMTTFHSLASLAYGCGLVCDDETEQEAQETAPLPPATAAPVDEQQSQQATTQLLDKLRAHDAEDDDAAAVAPAVDRREAFVQAGLDGDVGTTPELPQIDLFDRYCGEVPLVYQDFDMRLTSPLAQSSAYRFVRTQDFCWSDHGFDLVGRFNSGAAQLLDEQFTVAFTMTDRQLNENTDVDTDKFRSAIWYYTQRVYGISNDDYDYGEVNYLVSRQLKTYVKKVICYPERITVADFMNMGLALRPEERCHINLLALEARKQASLLYGLHTLLQFMSSR